jgi:PAS domain S-box-containing protein
VDSSQGLARRSAWTRFRSFFPSGEELQQTAWWTRHRGVLVLLALHVPALLVFGLWQGFNWLHVALEVGAVAALTLLAALPFLYRRLRSVLASLGLITCSALLVHLSGGFIEMHFHFFVMLGVILLYQDWAPFLTAIAYVALHHGIVGTIDPTSVYNHAEGWAQPWTWAGIHAFFVLGLSAANLVTWRLIEDAHHETETVLNSAGEGLVGLDAEGRVVFANEAAAMLAGTSRAGLVGRSFLDLVEPSHGPIAGAVPEPGHRGAGSGRMRRSDGRLGSHVDWVSSPGHGDRSRVAVVVALMDVTHRLQAEETLRRTNERLADIDRMRTQLLNTASHELNTPLTALRLQLDALEVSLRDRDGPVRMRFDVLSRNLDRLIRLVQDMLDVSRLQAGRLEIHRAPVRLALLLEQTTSMFTEAARASGVRLTVQGDRFLEVEADAHRLEQVTINLISNALKATPSGGVIQVRAAQEGGEAVVRVNDTGRGLTAEQCRRLFEPFVKVHEPATDRRGSGLGLYISRGILEAHGGRIWVESDGPDRGSTFCFALPLLVSAGAPSRGLAQNPTPRAAGPQTLPDTLPALP